MHYPNQAMFHELMKKAVTDSGFTIMMKPDGDWGTVHTSLLTVGVYEGKPCECPRYLVELLGLDDTPITCKQKLEEVDYIDFRGNFNWAAMRLPNKWLTSEPYKYMLFYGCAVDAEGFAEFDFSCAYSDLSDALSHARRNKTTRYVWDQVDKKAINLCDEENNAGPVMFPQ